MLAYKMKNNKALSVDGVLGCNELDKIKIVKCRHKCANCKIILFEINRFFLESELYRNDKQYEFSVIALKKVFEKTYELSDPVAQGCVDLYKVTVIESLENIILELKRMQKGIFGNRRYKRSYLMAEEALKELKKIAEDGKQNEIQDSLAPAVDKRLNLPAV